MEIGWEACADRRGMAMPAREEKGAQRAFITSRKWCRSRAFLGFLGRSIAAYVNAWGDLQQHTCSLSGAWVRNPHKPRQLTVRA